jgi:hypothetical protein
MSIHASSSSVEIWFFLFLTIRIFLLEEVLVHHLG